MPKFEVTIDTDNNIFDVVKDGESLTDFTSIDIYSHNDYEDPESKRTTISVSKNSGKNRHYVMWSFVTNSTVTAKFVEIKDDLSDKINALMQNSIAVVRGLAFSASDTTNEKSKQ